MLFLTLSRNSGREIKPLSNSVLEQIKMSFVDFIERHFIEIISQIDDITKIYRTFIDGTLANHKQYHRQMTLQRFIKLLQMEHFPTIKESTCITKIFKTALQTELTAIYTLLSLKVVFIFLFHHSRVFQLYYALYMSIPDYSHCSKQNILTIKTVYI